MEASNGKIRADVAHDKLAALGYTGSERTTRRVVAQARKAWQAGHRRVHRPWVPEPGLWFQWDFGTGPVVAGVATLLFCAWLAWSRFRVVLPIRDKTLPTVVACIDTTLRRFGGCPTYALTDNEKTVTVEHVARIAIRNPDMVAAGGHYGLTVATCLSADAPSKGGSEATVRVVKADLVPTDTNLLAAYADWVALEAACEMFCEQVNARPHRVTRRAPVDMLAEERPRLHRLPEHPWTAAFGETRTVGCPQPMVQLDWCLYSVPYQLAGETVWVRYRGEEVIVTHLGADGPVEVARHRELHEHRGYLTDERKVAAYRAALAEVVMAADVVLDLGAGTGMLGYFACEAGAKSVIAVDRGDIIGLARRIAADNGYEDRISHIWPCRLRLGSPHRSTAPSATRSAAWSTTQASSPALPTRGAACSRRGGRLVPAAFRIFLAPVTFDLGREAVEFWASKPADLDVGAARVVVANTEAKYNVTPGDLTALAPGAELAAFGSDHDDPIRGSAAFVVEEAGRFDGFVGWFEARMSPSITITNDPWSGDRIDRWCNFYPVDEALDVRVGDRVRVRLDVRPRLGVVSWSADVTRGRGDRRRYRHSTFRGSFLTAETVGTFVRDAPVSSSDRLDALGDILDLIDGSRTQSDVVEALGDRIGTTFVSSAELEAFVRNVVTLAG
jgi:transposase